MATVIKIENLSKKYIIGHQQQEQYTALRDVLMHNARGLGQRLFHPLLPKRKKTRLEDFWALKDINIEIEQGDRVGIIGRNGAGKSTLLKILSRITEPTTGRISINGRVASLLEVGTGFHPELTGRENIYLNGAILGMTRQEIKKFDQIVDFSEVEKFLDTPVKRFSSGMYVRLAFAVAAHLDPEILIVDEVLAVGDVQFQKKCLGKMHQTKENKNTILFVSHNMASISHICNKTMVLENGNLKLFTETKKSIDYYLQSQIKNSKYTPLSKRKDRNGTGDIVFTDIKMLSISDNTIKEAMTGDNIKFIIKFKSNKILHNVAFRLQILSEKQGVLLTCNNAHTDGPLKTVPTGPNQIICIIKSFQYYLVNTTYH